MTAAQPPTILLAEDYRELRQFLVMVLHGQGYTVIGVDRGAEALRVCERHAGPIHLLLTDIHMPEMDGLELARRIRARRPAMPVLYISAHPDPALPPRQETDGPKAAFLLKPFTIERLMCQVRELLAP